MPNSGAKRLMEFFQSYLFFFLPLFPSCNFASIYICLYTVLPSGFWSSSLQTFLWLLNTWLTMRYFPHPSRLVMGPIQPSIQWVPGLSRGKAGAARRDHSTPSSAEVKERQELYLYSPSGSSWPVLGWTLHTRVTLLLLSILLTCTDQFNRITLTNESVISINW
jgi:hypothetical protein